MPSQVALSNPFHNLEAQSRTLLLVLLFYLSYSYLRAFEPITSVNTPPVSDLIVFHSPSKLLAWQARARTNWRHVFRLERARFAREMALSLLFCRRQSPRYAP